MDETFDEHKRSLEKTAKLSQRTPPFNKTDPLSESLYARQVAHLRLADDVSMNRSRLNGIVGISAVGSKEVGFTVGEDRTITKSIVGILYGSQEEEAAAHKEEEEEVPEPVVDKNHPNFDHGDMQCRNHTE